MADFGGDVELEEFRAEARAWLTENFPASLKGKGMQAALADEGGEVEDDLKPWQ